MGEIHNVASATICIGLDSCFCVWTEAWIRHIVETRLSPSGLARGDYHATAWLSQRS
jgi:hypothetical protein